MDVSIPMALVDFVPVIFFAIAAIILQKDLYHLMPKGSYALMACGQIDIIAAGALKALYKLLYAAGICDFAVLNSLFFPLQTLGFMFAGFGIGGFINYRTRMLKRGMQDMLGHKIGDIYTNVSSDLIIKSSAVAPIFIAAAVAPPYFSGTIIFVVIMCMGMAMVCLGLSYYAFAVNKKGATVLFVFAFICSLGMGYLSSQDFSMAYMNWIAELTNVAGQAFLLAGTLMIHGVVKENAE